MMPSERLVISVSKYLDGSKSKLATRHVNEVRRNVDRLIGAFRFLDTQLSSKETCSYEFVRCNITYVMIREVIAQELMFPKYFRST
jgi:hypothetical protein